MPSRSSIITLKGIRARGHHGLFEAEREQGQVFLVDVVMTLNIHMAATHDEVNYTAHYGEVATTVQRFITGEAVNLIETLAVQIADAILTEQPLVEDVEVTIHKPQAPIPVDFANVSVTVKRSQRSE